ncbi:uncharacterized protein [Parasteatoda tepidariorum]|uniref:uncharacterized protein isoform X1 n=2 Tax=Parasteatoda tepidariorum TaxID=114398 RepID=UPI001C725E4F|nr:uncharacterized protein LOC107442644 isoform X2 [Parasteatoda tepidariorum]XP_042897684.1 uncharacterized protein LOC107442644 isoform X2 [Parasteatoda tepidariorum]
MLSAHQIFRDSKENDLTSVAKDRKLNSADNYKNVGLKISTNINREIKSNPDSVEKSKKMSSRAMKSCPEIDVKNHENVLKDTKKSEDLEEWPEIENMYIYEEPKDEYEDIIPKNERFTRDELYFFYGTSYIGRIDAETEEEENILKFTLDDLTDFYTPPPSPPVPEENLFVDLPLAFIPFPSPLKDWN